MRSPRSWSRIAVTGSRSATTLMWSYPGMEGNTMVPSSPVILRARRIFRGFDAENTAHIQRRSYNFGRLRLYRPAMSNWIGYAGHSAAQCRFKDCYDIGKNWAEW